MFRKRFAFTPVIITVVSILALFICLPVAYAHQEVGLQVAGKVVETEPASFMDGNRVMVPVREIATALGTDVSWDGEKQAVKIVRQEWQITMLIGELQAMVNGKIVQLELAPKIIDGRAMVPVRVLAEGLQVPVSWDSEKQIVNLGSSGLIAGSSLDFPPFEFKEGNEIVGFDIDLLQAIEEVSGEDFIVKDIRFDQLFPSLRSGQIDLIISSLTIVEQRKEVVDFTSPYFDWGAIILIPKADDQNISLEDLAGKKIASQVGTHAHDLVRTLGEKYPNTQLNAYESLEEVWAAVEEGQAEAAVVEYSLTAYYLNNHEESKLQMAGNVFASRPIGIAVQKGNSELLDKLNKGLETIKENGTYDRICEKWFGSSHHSRNIE